LDALKTAQSLNQSLFAFDQRAIFDVLFQCLPPRQAAGGLLMVTDNLKLPAPPAAPGQSALETRLSFKDAGFLESPISFKFVMRRICEAYDAMGAEGPGETAIMVDMSWALASNSATANFQNWMEAAEALVGRLGVRLISAYNRRLLIDDQLLAALRGHPVILTGAGLMPNPHWLPSALLMRGTPRAQLDHWLAAISPELAAPEPAPETHAAEGTDPMWLLRRGAEEPAEGTAETVERWKIRCFGRLRVYRQNGGQIVWDAPGGATRKTKTLFAYLLQKGGEGAEAEDLADLLWPDAASSEVARNRLHHTIRYLRQAVSPQGAGTSGDGSVLRDGSRYVLVPPERSWLDISAFEQLCRQSTAHMRSGALDEALLCLGAADRLYTGDLFADIPAGYVDDEARDWCWSKRVWLREMFFKVQRDAASIHRRRHDFSSALVHCQKALAIDPLCEIAHEEAMRVFAAQGRPDAVDRQYKLYLGALTHFDDRPSSAALKAAYEKIKNNKNNELTDQ
jgi:two-component SAPR family response regulator